MRLITQNKTHALSIGFPWTSDRPVAVISTYKTQKTSIHATNRIRARDPSKRVAADLRLMQHKNERNKVLCSFYRFTHHQVPKYARI